jgi:hypothetical protein
MSQKVLKTLLASRRLAPISRAQSSNGSFIRQARINPKFGGMLLNPSPITFRFRNVAECANALIPVAISRETIHTICVGEGYSCNVSTMCIGRATTISCASHARIGEANRQSGKWDMRTVGRGIASWLRSAVGHQSPAIDTSAGN